MKMSQKKIFTGYCFLPLNSHYFFKQRKRHKGIPTRHSRNAYKKKKKKGKSLKIILGMFSFLSSSLGEIIQILICIWHCDISVSALQSPGLSYPIYKFEVICLSLELSRHFLFSDVSQSLDSVGL